MEHNIFTFMCCGYDCDGLFTKYSMNYRATPNFRRWCTNAIDQIVFFFEMLKRQGIELNVNLPKFEFLRCA